MSAVEKISAGTRTRESYALRLGRQIGKLIWLGAQEPFFQFIALGFAIWLGVETWQAHRRHYEIHVGPAELQRFNTIYFQQFGQAPGPIQLRELIARYVRDEISVREGMALHLDKDDEIIRRRMVQKYEFLQSDLVIPEKPAPGVLEHWFEENRSRYETPEGVSFAQIYFSADRDGDDAARLRASKALATLERTHATTAPDMGDSFPGPTDVDAMRPEEANRLFGRSDFSEQIFKLPVDHWSGPFRSGFGWHLVYVSSHIPPAMPALSDIRDRVLTDYLDAQRQNLNQKAYEKLRAKYQVIIEESQP